MTMCLNSGFAISVEREASNVGDHLVVLNGDSIRIFVHSRIKSSICDTAQYDAHVANLKLC